MQRGLRIGQIFGINIHIDWSWIFIFLLITWSLAAGVLPAWHPDWGPGLRWAVAFAASLLFFASVLAHELSHSLVAKAQGLPVRRITLFLFGGVSNIEREPPAPSKEFWMAVVGPLTSLALGLLFLTHSSTLAGGVLEMRSDPTVLLAELGPASTLLLWLGSVNIMVALFNLIPGFPLDGGRILRSIIWAITKDLRKATRWAAGVGQVIALVFILCGIAMVFGARVPVFGAGVLNGVWLAFIGWFLNNAAVASYQQLIIHDLLEDVRVARLMRSDMPTVSPNLLVSDLIYHLIMETDERAFPVMQGEWMVGLVSLEDVRKLPRDAWEHTTVSQIMTPAEALTVVEPNDDTNAALEKLTRRDVRQIPVVENGHLVGLLRRRDIVKWLQLQAGFEPV